MKYLRAIILIHFMTFLCHSTYAQKVGRCKTRDGGEYYGQIVSKKPSGKGETIYKNGNTYKGDYVDGQRQGYGIYTFFDGEKYEGEWFRDQQHGKGTYFFKNGDIYTGLWFRDYMHGHGIMKYNNGDFYDGNWNFDKRNGKGIYYLADSTILFEGEWLNNVPISSNLKRSFNNGQFNPYNEEGNMPFGKKEWTGTGFAISNTYIATNYHVVESAKTIVIKTSLGESYNGELVSSDQNNDIAIIKLTNYNLQSDIPYSIKNSISDVGEQIFVLGYPLTTSMGNEVKLTTGVISSKTGFQGDISLYQISAPIQPGNSGGPLFDDQGNLIGIISSKHKNVENVGYAVKSLYLINLIDCTLEMEKPHKNTLASLPLPQKVKAIKDFIFIIYCSN